MSCQIITKRHDMPENQPGFLLFLHGPLGYLLPPPPSSCLPLNLVVVTPSLLAESGPPPLLLSTWSLADERCDVLATL